MIGSFQLIFWSMFRIIIYDNCNYIYLLSLLGFQDYQKNQLAYDLLKLIIIVQSESLQINIYVMIFS